MRHRQLQICRHNITNDNKDKIATRFKCTICEHGLVVQLRKFTLNKEPKWKYYTVCSNENDHSQFTKDE